MHYDASKRGDAGWDTAKLALLEDTFRKKADERVSDLKSRISGHDFKRVFDDCRKDVEDALAGDGWKTQFPGKDILRAFSKARKLGEPPVLENAIISCMSVHTEWIPQELADIIKNVTT